MEVAGPHDGVDFRGAADIGDGVAGHGHEVGDPARFENADVLAAEEFGGGSGGGAKGPGGVDACRDHGLEFEVAAALCALTPHDIDVGELKYVVKRNCKREFRVWPRPTG
jgi:hypothetical protein